MGIWVGFSWSCFLFQYLVTASSHAMTEISLAWWLILPFSVCFYFHIWIWYLLLMSSVSYFTYRFALQYGYKFSYHVIHWGFLGLCIVLSHLFSTSDGCYSAVQHLGSLRAAHLVPSQCLGRQAALALIHLPQNPLVVQILLAHRLRVQYLAAHPPVSLGSHPPLYPQHLRLVLPHHRLLEVPCLPSGHQLLLHFAVLLHLVVSIPRKWTMSYYQSLFVDIIFIV